MKFWSGFFSVLSGKLLFKMCFPSPSVCVHVFLAGEFVISPVEGELRVRKNAELDRENIAFYNLTIAAKDRGLPPLSSTVSVGDPRAKL